MGIGHFFHHSAVWEIRNLRSVLNDVDDLTYAVFSSELHPSCFAGIIEYHKCENCIYASAGGAEHLKPRNGIVSELGIDSAIQKLLERSNNLVL